MLTWVAWVILIVAFLAVIVSFLWWESGRVCRKFRAKCSHCGSKNVGVKLGGGKTPAGVLYCKDCEYEDKLGVSKEQVVAIGDQYYKEKQEKEKR